MNLARQIAEQLTLEPNVDEWEIATKIAPWATTSRVEKLLQEAHRILDTAPPKPTFDQLVDRLVEEDLDAIRRGRPARERVFMIAERVARWKDQS